VGLYLSAMTFASVLSNLLWQKAGRTRDTYSLLRTASFLTALTPLLAATLPWLMRSVGFTVEQHGLLPAYLFTAVFLLAGSGESGRSIGLMALLLDISPDKERTSYIGLVNTALGFVSLLPILSGALIDRVGFEPIFFATTGLLLLAYLFTLGFKSRN
jgi:MFS family permease